MAILIFIVAHWYLSLFSQTFFHHRYAAHSMFTMSKGWERFFFIFTWFSQGTSYLSPHAYGVLHRQHHAFADTEKDPHSPKYDHDLFTMMWKTKNVYNDIFYGRVVPETRWTDGVPEWHRFDKFANSWVNRGGWMIFYTAFYFVFATQWWMWLFLPLHFVMGPFHGAIINWFAHKYGYVNFKVKDTSKNFLPVDFLMLGESYHNNHHKHGNRPNFGWRWFEIDPVYYVILLFNGVGIIKLKKPEPAVAA